MQLLAEILIELLKQTLPELLTFIWEKSHESTTVEQAAANPALRDRLLAAIRLHQQPGGHDPHH